MRTLLLASAALAFAGSAALAQPSNNNPKSSAASNIDAADTHSVIAPQLPSPGATGSAEDYLQRARAALRAGRTGETQEALERAETRTLDRSTEPQLANQPDNSPRVEAIRKALQALASRDRAGAMSAIDMALASSGTPNAPIPAAAMTPPPAEPMGTVPAPASVGPSGVPTSANGVAVNPAGGSNLPAAGNQGAGPATP